ncbi:MAG: hypothetical protein Q9213_003527 [Squamulea squamosa]
MDSSPNPADRNGFSTRARIPTQRSVPPGRSCPYIKYYRDNRAFQTPTQSYVQRDQDNPTCRTSTHSYIHYYRDNAVFETPALFSSPAKQMAPPRSSPTPYGVLIPQPTPASSNSQQPNYAAWPPIQILHTFNLVHSIPAMPANHHMVRELQQEPIHPQILLEHRLRVTALEGWWQKQRILQTEEGNRKAAEHQEEQKKMEREERQKRIQRWAELEKGINRSVGHSAVTAGQTAEQSPVVAPGQPPILGLRSVAPPNTENEAVDGGVEDDQAEDGDGDDSAERSPDTAVGPRPLLGRVPVTPQCVRCETDDGLFDAGPWEEIGRQWARVRPWELY